MLKRKNFDLNRTGKSSLNFLIFPSNKIFANISKTSESHIGLPEVLVFTCNSWFFYFHFSWVCRCAIIRSKTICSCQWTGAGTTRMINKINISWSYILTCYTFYLYENTQVKVNKLTTKTTQRRQWRRSGEFNVNFELITHLFLVFLLLSLNM